MRLALRTPAASSDQRWFCCETYESSQLSFPANYSSFFFFTHNAAASQSSGPWPPPPPPIHAHTHTTTPLWNLLRSLAPKFPCCAILTTTDQRKALWNTRLGRLAFQQQRTRWKRTGGAAGSTSTHKAPNYTFGGHAHHRSEGAHAENKLELSQFPQQLWKQQMCSSAWFPNCARIPWRDVTSNQWGSRADRIWQ